MKYAFVVAAFALGARAIIPRANAARAITASLSSSFENLNSHATDSRFGPFVSDGSTGGTINGISLLALSDVEKPGEIPLHTAFAYIDPSNPLNVSVIADYSESPSKFYTGGGGGIINYMPGEDPPGFAAEFFAPAPRVAPIPIPGNSTGALCVWPIHQGSGGNYSFNTMFEINVLPQAELEQMKSNVPAVRTKPILFSINKGQAGYGSKALTPLNDQYFYAWEGDSTGLKLALVPWATRTDTTTWSYWHGDKNTYVQNAPLNYGDPTGNLFHLSGWGGFDLGFDAKYVERFKTYVLTYTNENAPGSSLYASYSTSGKIEGPYTQPEAIFQPIYDSVMCEGINGMPTYGVQAHWDYFGTTSDKLLVSWVSCAMYTNFGIVTWNS